MKNWREICRFHKVIRKREIQFSLWKEVFDCGGGKAEGKSTTKNRRKGSLQVFNGLQHNGFDKVSKNAWVYYSNQTSGSFYFKAK